MPNQILDRGHTANLGANIVHGNLNVIGVGASYTISIGGAAPAAHVIAPGAADVYPINNATVCKVTLSNQSRDDLKLASWQSDENLNILLWERCHF
jgi:hypothetical protein